MVPMTFEESMEHVVHGFEIAGVVVLVVGSLVALFRFVGRPPPPPSESDAPS